MKKALIVVDFQNDFVSGTLGFEKARGLEDKIADKIREYRKGNNDIIFTFDTHFEDYLSTHEGKNLPVKHCIKDTDGWELFGKIRSMKIPEDKSFEKSTFGSLELAKFLETKVYDEIELVGLVSNICVISNAVLAKSALPEANIIVDAQCTASFDESMNEKVLDIMSGLQINVINR